MKDNFLIDSIRGIGYEWGQFEKFPKEMISCDKCYQDINHYNETDYADVFSDTFDSIASFVAQYGNKKSDITKIIKSIEDNVQEHSTSAYVFIGIHKDGVDEEQEIIDRFLKNKESARKYYQKILGIEIHNGTPNYEYDEYDTNVALFDITGRITDERIEAYIKEEK